MNLANLQRRVGIPLALILVLGMSTAIPSQGGMGAHAITSSVDRDAAETVTIKRSKFRTADPATELSQDRFDYIVGDKVFGSLMVAGLSSQASAAVPA